MDEEISVMREAAKLSGIIFKKADMDKDFVRVYTRVFEGMVKGDFKEEVQVLELLGDVGG